MNDTPKTDAIANFVEQYAESPEMLSASLYRLAKHYDRKRKLAKQFDKLDSERLLRDVTVNLIACAQSLQILHESVVENRSSKQPTTNN